MTGKEIRALLTELGESMGAGPLSFDEAGFCQLAVDDMALALELNEESETLSLYAPAGEIPQGGGKVVREALLSANFLFRGTGGATLGADPDSGQAVMYYSLPFAAVTQVKFERVVENFVNMAESWTRQTREAPTSSAVPVSGEQFTGMRA